MSRKSVALLVALCLSLCVACNREENPAPELREPPVQTEPEVVQPVEPEPEHPGMDPGKQQDQDGQEQQ